MDRAMISRPADAIPSALTDSSEHQRAAA